MVDGACAGGPGTPLGAWSRGGPTAQSLPERRTDESICARVTGKVSLETRCYVSPSVFFYRPGLEWWMERGLANLARGGVPARDEARRSNRRQREEQTKVSVCTGDRENPGESLARIGAV